MPPPPHFRFDEDIKNNPPKVTKDLLRHIGNFLKPYAFKMLILAVIILVSCILGVIPSILTVRIIDEGIIAQDFDHIFSMQACVRI